MYNAIHSTSLSLSLFLNSCVKYNRKFTILTIVSIHVSGVKYIPIVVCNRHHYPSLEPFILHDWNSFPIKR